MKILLLISILLVSVQSFALDLYGVYLGSCKREIGTIIDVRDQSFDILTLKGVIKTIPRYQAIYLAAYPIDLLPISQFSKDSTTEVYSIKSRSGNDIKPLLKGWAINFTEDKVSFLTTKRDEVLVDKTDLWKLSKEQTRPSFKKKKTKKILFIDPYPFAHCKRKKKKTQIFPQKLYADAVDVKREFDRLQEGHKELDKFIRRQVFYPKPQVYSNKSILGLWLMSGARYGASDSRPNNFSPFLRNELSLGAYSYQHLITTGSGPILDGTHDETQTHFYYRMKAEYLHISIMADPNILLVGSQYEWKPEDLDSTDFRANESFFLELGFDYGKLSFEISPVMSLVTGVKFGSVFNDMSVNLARFGVRYTDLDYTINFIAGQGSEGDSFSGDKVDFNIFRANFQKKIKGKHDLTLSLINKSSDGSVSSNPFDFKSLSLSGIYTHEYKRRFYFSGLFGLEKYEITASEGGLDFSENKTAVKLGANASLKF